ncbi:hypothetical protein P3S67_011423 [Capsicum chacoense]
MKGWNIIRQLKNDVRELNKTKLWIYSSGGGFVGTAGAIIYSCTDWLGERRDSNRRFNQASVKTRLMLKYCKKIHREIHANSPKSITGSAVAIPEIMTKTNPKKPSAAAGPEIVTKATPEKPSAAAGSETVSKATPEKPSTGPSTAASPESSSGPSTSV